MGYFRDITSSTSTKFRGRYMKGCNTLPVMYCYENETVCHIRPLHAAVMVVRLSKLENDS